MSVNKNTSKPESQLYKKSNTVWYYAVEKSNAIGETLMANILGAEKPADLMTIVWQAANVNI